MSEKEYYICKIYTMSNYFKDVANSPKKMEQKLLGPDYKYYKFIKSPKQMNMSPNGNLGALANNIAGIINYADLLVGGGGNASKTGEVLGNSFFLKTGAKCKDTKSGKTVDRYMYINNIPDGSIPFLSNVTGVKADSMRGLLPGILSDTAQINPMDMFSSFMQDSEPKCKEITRNVVNSNGVKSRQTRHVAITDIKEGFLKFNQDNVSDINNVYLLLVSFLILYLVYRMYVKEK